MPEAKSRALDNLGRVYARIGNFQKAINVYVLIGVYPSSFEHPAIVRRSVCWNTDEETVIHLATVLYVYRPFFCRCSVVLQKIS